jgi:3-hydroxybutyryl-CoA dehydrogenase
MVLAGWYGKKSGRGFYDWSGAEPVPVEMGL